MLAKEQKRTEKHKQVLRSRLELYKQGKPNREAVKEKYTPNISHDARRRVLRQWGAGVVRLKG